MAVSDDFIKEKALDLFSLKGYTAVSTREIAQAAGITEMTLFRKFQTKQNLFRQILQQGWERDPVNEKIRTLTWDSPQTALHRLIDLLSSKFQAHKKIISIIFNSPEVLVEEFKSNSFRLGRELYDDVLDFLKRVYGETGASPRSFELLCQKILAQLVGCSLLETVLQIPVDWEAMVADFSNCLGLDS